ncbi:hypothetical protein C0J52_26442, partial [Blattella germanica]
NENYVSCSRELEEEGRVFVFRLCTVTYEWRAVEMDPAGVSGTVTVEDQRSYFKIETLRGKNPTEIHRAFVTSTDERSVKLVTDALEKDRRATCEELSEATGISPTSKRKICARWVPHCLTSEPKTSANTDGKRCRILSTARTLTCSQNRRNLCADVIIFLWKRFLSPYPNHSTDEQKWCPGWNNKAAETLGFSYTEAGRLY